MNCLKGYPTLNQVTTAKVPTKMRHSEPGVAIELRSVTKVYPKGVRALEDVSFRIAEGERACLLGPNGAGKTTIVRLLTGAGTPTAGEALLCGVSAGSPDYLDAKRRVGVVPQGPGMYDDLMTGEYLSLASLLYGRRGVSSWVDHLGLEPYLTRPLAHLSSGFQRRVVLAAALLAEPEVLLLDEPTVGLDPLAAREVRGYLREAMVGRTVLLCTHNLAEAEALCESAVILRKGRVLLHERIDDLRRRFPVKVHLAGAQGPAALSQALAGLGIKHESDEAGVWATLAEPEREVPSLLRRLLGLGLDIYECRIEEPSLEDLFVDIVGDGA